MLYTPYLRGITTLLLYVLLLHSCQSRLNALKEEAPVVPPESGMHAPSSSGEMTTLSGPLPPTTAPSIHATAAHTPIALQKKQIPTTTSSRTLPTVLVSHPPVAIPLSSRTTKSPGTFIQSPSRIFTASSGAWVKFSHVNGQWQAALQSGYSAYTTERTLAVVSPTAIGPQLAWLQGQDRWTSRARIHILNMSQPPYSPCVYLGKAGLLGGSPSGDEEDSKPSAAPKSLQDLVRLCNDAEPESAIKKDCQARMEACIDWFEAQNISELESVREELIEYTALAHIKWSQENSTLLDRYFGAFHSKLDEVVDKYVWGEEKLLEVLEYTLSVIDKTV